MFKFGCSSFPRALPPRGPDPVARHVGCSGGAAAEQGNACFAALKLFLALGPLLGLAALELILLRRDKRRAPAGPPLVPARPGAERQAGGRAGRLTSLLPYHLTMRRAGFPV